MTAGVMKVAATFAMNKISNDCLRSSWLLLPSYQSVIAHSSLLSVHRHCLTIVTTHPQLLSLCCNVSRIVIVLPSSYLSDCHVSYRYTALSAASFNRTHYFSLPNRIVFWISRLAMDAVSGMFVMT